MLPSMGDALNIAFVIALLVGWIWLLRVGIERIGQVEIDWWKAITIAMGAKAASRLLGPLLAVENVVARLAISTAIYAVTLTILIAVIAKVRPGRSAIIGIGFSILMVAGMLALAMLGAFDFVKKPAE